MARIICCSVCKHYCNPDARCMTCGLLPFERDAAVERARVATEDARAWQPKLPRREREGEDHG